MEVATRAPEIRGTELDGSGESNTSTLKLIKHRNPRGIKHLRVLNEIAIKWTQEGYYSTTGRAFEALIGGDL